MKSNFIDYRNDNKWKIYVHIVPKELTGYKSVFIEEEN